MIEKKHVFITGGSSGIGLEMALLAAKEGAAVSLLARDITRLEAAQTRINSTFPECEIYLCVADVCNETELQKAVDLAEVELGPVSDLVHCAGMAAPSRLLEQSMDEIRQLMEVNYFGTVNLLQILGRRMCQRGYGRIGIAGSTAAIVGIEGQVAYGATKYAIRGLALGFRSECRPFGVSVSVCHPSDTDTPMLASEEARKPPETKAISALTAVRRADVVAKSFWRGMQAGRAEIFPGLDIWALGRLGPVVAPVLRYWFDKVADRARAKGAHRLSGQEQALSSAQAKDQETQ